MTGRCIAHYDILEKLGEGGMGAVYRARDKHLDRSVAIKVLRGETRVNPDRKKRFVLEAKSASALNHPNIIHIYDIGEENGIDFIVMEFVDGTTLDQILGRKGLRISEVLKYSVQVADALTAAHGAGIVHRDLKPANIMVTERGHVKVLDFGLAKLTQREPEEESAAAETRTAVEGPRTEEGTIVGTVAYMSPEQAEGRKVDGRSDIFSFGAVLYEMVTGRRAFQGETRMSTLAAVLRQEPTPVSETVPTLPRDLARIIERCLRKSPERRLQTMADLKVALEELKEESETGTLAAATAAAPPRGRRGLFVLAAVAAVAIVIAGITWWRLRPGAPARAPLVRLTADSGVTDFPAISRDGKFLAYASDRSGEPHLDIWVKQIPDGEPVRLTRDPSDDWAAEFSPDGGKILFRSNREGGGLYVIPTLGGSERLLVKRGGGGRFSPDGNWVAYTTSAATEGTQLWVIPASGGTPRRMAAEFFIAAGPAWSPNGRHLMFRGIRDAKGPPEETSDWYVIPFSGGPAVRTGIAAIHRREKFRGLTFPQAWLAGPERIIYHAHHGDSQNLWQVSLSRSFQIEDVPARVTFGTADEEVASVTPSGRMVYPSRIISADLWTVPLEADHAKAGSDMKQLTRDAADDYDPQLSPDGSKLLFVSRRSGNWDLFIRDLRTGQETPLTQTPEREYGVLSPDGARVAYFVRENNRSPLFIISAAGGAAEKVCDDCGLPYQWSPDGATIVYQIPGQKMGLGLFDVAARQKRDWFHHATHSIFPARLSPDQRWLAFTAGSGPGRTPVWIAPVRDGNAAGEGEWIEISNGGFFPQWSPGGSVLYFYSERDGFQCLWARRLDAASRKPVGDLIPIHHVHSRRLSVRNLNMGAGIFALARDRAVFNLGEHTGNIWMTELPR